ncbi:hypothetical protein DIPPA_16327 [Diplonema papillatum]|nr:hypothetical protein DIPPA_16327 [Diplonema papillatum]
MGVPTKASKRKRHGTKRGVSEESSSESDDESVVPLHKVSKTKGETMVAPVTKKCQFVEEREWGAEIPLAKFPKSDTMCQERGDTDLLMEDIDGRNTEEQKAEDMVNELFQQGRFMDMRPGSTRLSRDILAQQGTPFAKSSPEPNRGRTRSPRKVTIDQSPSPYSRAQSPSSVAEQQIAVKPKRNAWFSPRTPSPDRTSQAASLSTSKYASSKPAKTSKHALRKAYESQANTWNAGDSIFGMVRNGDLTQLQEHLEANPELADVKDALGANILHQSLLIDGPRQRQISCWLLEMHPKLLVQEYGSEAFLGEACLHFPIVHRDVAFARLLVGRYPEALLARARGSFFREPKEGCYFGEYPLLFAVSTNQPDLVSTFLEIGQQRLNLSKADHLSFVDTDKNTVLHMAVYHNLPEMYDFVESLCRKHCAGMLEEGSGALVNAQGYTPFTLAAKLGKQEIFDHLLRRCSIAEWRYGPLVCRKILLSELDRPHTSSDRVSAKGVLQILEEEEHSHLLMHPLILQLQQCKWDTFAGRCFLNRVLYVAAFVFIFFASSVLRGGQSRLFPATPSTDDPPLLSTDQEVVSILMIFSTFFSLFSSVFGLLSASDAVQEAGPVIFVALSVSLFLRYVIHFLLRDQPVSAHPDEWAKFAVCSSVFLLCLTAFFPSTAALTDALVISGAAYKLSLEVREMFTDGTQYLSCRGAQLMENLVSLSFSLSVFAAAVLRGIAGKASDGTCAAAADLTSAFSAMCLWIYVLWLLLGFRITGPFVIMVWKMLRSDMIRFLLIFGSFLFGFAQTFFILLNESGLEQFMRRVHHCFVALLGQADLSHHEDSNRFPILTTGLLLSYVLLVSVLLLNLLVAMMSSTYTEIQGEAEEVWRLQWTRLIFSIESEMSESERSHAGNCYWALINTDHGPKRFLVLPMKVDDSDVAQYQKKAEVKAASSATPDTFEAGSFQEKRGPSIEPMTRPKMERGAGLHDILEDPGNDSCSSDAVCRAFAAYYGDFVSKDDLLSARTSFQQSLTDAQLVQLLVGVHFAPGGSDFMNLLSRHYFGAPLPTSVPRAQCTRFFAALLQTTNKPVPEIRAILTSFAKTPRPGLIAPPSPELSASLRERNDPTP